MATTGMVGGSGIDVSSIVSQLMTIERRPLQVLQQRESQIEARLTAFGRVQSALDKLQATANVLRQGATFSAARAKASNEAATATVSGSPQVGTYSLSVSQLARGQSMASAAFATAATDVGSGTLTLRNADGSAVLATINIGDSDVGTLTEVRDEINAANIAVRASLINDGGLVRLVLNSSETGSANGFQVEVDAGLSGLALAETQSAQDASFSINGLSLTSASNNLTNVIEGLSINLNQAPPAGSPVGSTVDSEVIVEQDADSVKTAATDFVAAYNEFEKLVAELTSFDPSTKEAAVLNGESVLRRIQTSIRSLVRGTMTAPVGEHTRLSDVGFEFQSGGTLKLNETKFAAALASGSSKVARLFSATSSVPAEQGFAVRLREQIQTVIDPDGMLDARQDGLRSSIRSIDQQQERLEARMALIEARLRREYSKLDALLSARDSQSAALANALAGLPQINQQG
jgi:flagellar hook-associated protein 2